MLETHGNFQNFNWLSRGELFVWYITQFIYVAGVLQWSIVKFFYNWNIVWIRLKKIQNCRSILYKRDLQLNNAACSKNRFVNRWIGHSWFFWTLLTRNQMENRIFCDVDACRFYLIWPIYYENEANNVFRIDCVLCMFLNPLNVSKITFFCWKIISTLRITKTNDVNKFVIVVMQR